MPGRQRRTAAYACHGRACQERDLDEPAWRSTQMTGIGRAEQGPRGVRAQAVPGGNTRSPISGATDGRPRASDRTMLRNLSGVLLLTLTLAGCTSTISPAAPAAPGPSDAPPGEAHLGETRYSCSGPPGFLPNLLDRPADAELEDHPSAAALRAAIAEVGPDIDMLPATGYWLTNRDHRVAEYLARDPRGAENDFVFASMENDGPGWRNGGWGGCRPEIVLDGLNLATWILDPDAPPPAAATTTFSALVTERTCTSGQAMGARLEAPSITYGQESVLVVFAARPLEGDAFDCPSNPPTRVVVQLSEPLGERHLLDAGFFPPAEPVAPAF